MHAQDTPHYILRPATQSDRAVLRRMITQMDLNPLGIHWQHFILAVDEAGNVIGCGQIKQHSDGSEELASIAVVPEWRRRGVARRIIAYLLKQHPGRLYLTCGASLEPMYQKFGFRVVEPAEMSLYFRRLSRLVGFVTHLFRQPNRMRVMRWK